MAGLLEWSNAIRFTMANDPGREVFKDQLNTHGFIFLDDYLENILAGPSQDPIIELVKTPGRKKVAYKKSKGLGSSNLRTMVSLKEHEELKENVAPLNSLHKALLQAKDLPTLEASSLPPPQTVASDIFVAPSGTPRDNQSSQTVLDTSSSDFLAPALLAQNDLSVIAEDDENSELNIQSRRNSEIPLTPALCTLTETQTTSDDHRHAHSSQAMAMAESSSDTFHSITLDSPSPQVPENAHHSVIPPFPPTLAEANPTKPTDAPESSMSSNTLLFNEAHRESDVESPNVIPPLPPTLPQPKPTKPTDAPESSMSTNALLINAAHRESEVESPDVHFLDSNAGSRDPELPSQDPSQVSLPGDKFGVTLFPTLPAPMPLRKSVRTSRDPSAGSSHIGANTPGALPGGKRTSWLKKAREVKALEVTIKHANTTFLAVPGPPSANALKRKSGDLLTSPEIVNLEGQERNSKSAKSNETDEAPLKAKPEPSQPRHKTPSMVEESSGQEGMLDRLKKTVEDLGARVGKSFSKSLGAAAATSALAEARAAAEARVVERLQKEEMTRISGSADTPLITTDIPSTDILVNSVDTPSAEPELEERRLSVSDLFPPLNRAVQIKDKSLSTVIADQHVPIPSPVPHQPSDPSVLDDHRRPNRESTTTTPPDSPPTSRRTSSPGKVFGKPPPVFIPPVSTSNNLLHDHGPSLPSLNAFSLPVSMSLGLGPRLQLPPSPKHVSPLSRQSTIESIQSDKIFDDTNNPAWMSETQDTDYSSRNGSQSQNPYQATINRDDSWPVDDKPASNMQWTFGDTMKEDSMTWSTLPSRSQQGDTGKLNLCQDDLSHGDVFSQNKPLPIASGNDTNGNFDERVAHGDSDLEDIVLHGQSAVSSVEKAPQNESQVSMVSSQSSQSHTGFLGQASRLLGSALGSSKKGSSDVKKVLQMAAVAAKKQQEESDKKAARLKEMENRRQLAIQRKAEEERTRILEQERKVKEEGERRKREREETTDKRPLKATVRKDEDNGKKRKVASSDTEKREAKKFPLKAIPKSSTMKPPSALGSSTAYNVSLQTAASSSTLRDSKPLKPPAITASTDPKGKGKAPTTPSARAQDDMSQPSQLVQNQMAARAKAQIQASHLASEPPVASESIELPEINSEYSDSDDEDRSKALPVWAQSPELRQALQLQSTINPDDIFGAIRPLRMEEMFKTRNSRFRARTSSANWTGADRLTMEEEREYAKRMGFK